MYHKGFATLHFRVKNGFTLIELIIAIALLAIFVGLALPSFFTAIQNNRITGQANELLTAFQLGRTEALKRNRPVVVCASDDGEECQGDWTDGWLVAEDNADAGSSSPDIAQVLRVWSAQAGNPTITGPAIFRILPRGEMDANMGVNFPAVIAMSIDGCSGEQARNILISRSGRVTSERDDCP